MIQVLALLLLAQDAELDALVGRLDHDELAVREKASADLAALGPKIVPRLLLLHRSTSSAEARSRSESLLRRYSFEALARSQPGDSIRQTLRGFLLADMDKHRETPGCWRPEGSRRQIELKHLLILWQSGSGHGQYLAIDRITPDEGGQLVVRRIAYQGTTPYRSQVKAEGVRVEEARLDGEESEALASLLQAAAALREVCAIERKEGVSWMSTGSFSLRFRIESVGIPVWTAAYTGFPSSENEHQYSHGRVLDHLLGTAMANRSWTEAKVLPEDRARALQWMSDHFADEAWWVKEHYLDMARFIGDETYAPFLGKVLKGLEGREGPSEKRQLKSAREALSRLPPAEK